MVAFGDLFLNSMFWSVLLLLLQVFHSGSVWWMPKTSVWRETKEWVANSIFLSRFSHLYFIIYGANGVLTLRTLFNCFNVCISLLWFCNWNLLLLLVVIECSASYKVNWLKLFYNLGKFGNMFGISLIIIQKMWSLSF